MPVPTITPFLYVPNLIGYARVALLVYAGWTCLDQPLVSICAYMLSMFLDAFDGMAARHFGQASQFGAVLDMVSDRVTTMYLCGVLAHLYDSHMLIFVFLIGLDFASHWIHMYASMLKQKTSHKAVSRDSNLILHAYYNVPYLMFFVCFFAESFYVQLFVLANENNGNINLNWTVPYNGKSYSFFYVCLLVSAPFFVFKQIANVVQLLEASCDIVALDVAKRG